MILTFKVEEVRALIAHAEGSVMHFRPYEKASKNTPPGLLLVGDEGVYLMSNGEPGLLNPRYTGKSREPKQQVVYAVECDPRTCSDWYEVKVAAFGGDDGGDMIPLPGLVAAVERAGQTGAAVISIDITPSTITLKGLG